MKKEKIEFDFDPKEHAFLFVMNDGETIHGKSITGIKDLSDKKDIDKKLTSLMAAISRTIDFEILNKIRK